MDISLSVPFLAVFSPGFIRDGGPDRRHGRPRVSSRPHGHRPRALGPTAPREAKSRKVAVRSVTLGAQDAGRRGKCGTPAARPGGRGSTAAGLAWAAAVKTNDARGARPPALPPGLGRPPERMQEAGRPAPRPPPHPSGGARSREGFLTEEGPARRPCGRPVGRLRELGLSRPLFCGREVDGSCLPRVRNREAGPQGPAGRKE